MSKLAVLSPHLDDAAIGCTEHLLDLCTRGVEVTVINVFSACGTGASYLSGVLPPEVAPSAVAVRAYEADRRYEDERAMAALGVNAVYLDFVDAAFRGEYGSVAELFSGRLGHREHGLAEQLAAALKPCGGFDAVLAPLGVGRHVDHLVVRAAVTMAGMAPVLAYYAEFPYAFRPWNWSLGLCREVMRMKKSFRLPGARKREILACYRSQLPLLFGDEPFAPELIVGDEPSLDSLRFPAR